MAASSRAAENLGKSIFRIGNPAEASELASPIAILSLDFVDCLFEHTVQYWARKKLELMGQS